MVSRQKGPTRHAYAWQIGPFWQDSLDITYMQYTRQTPMVVNIRMHMQHSLIYNHTQIGGAYLTHWGRDKMTTIL